jgi:hypothetical protein
LRLACLAYLLRWEIENSFANAGKAGVWTKVDSITLFDDFSYGMK